MISDYEAVAEASADAVQTIAEQETRSVARELAAAYRRMAAFYCDQLQLLGPQADARARGTDYTEQEAAADWQRIFDRPAD
jgi:hypothetical protein